MRTFNIQMTETGVRWSVAGPRRTHGLQPEKVPMDDQAGHRIERFAISREG